MRKGVAVSPGVVVGRALLVDNALSGADSEQLDAGQAAAELERLHRAIAATERELAALVTKVASQVGEHEAGIFRSHQLILADPSLVKKVKEHVTHGGLTAPSALRAVLNEYTAIFARINDEYLKHRMADVRDVIARVQSHLLEAPRDGFHAGHDPIVVVAHEILPSQAVSLGDINVAGIVTEAGSSTSHAAILARSRAIPAVSGVKGITGHVKSGDVIIVDGRSGHVIANPGPEVLAVYRTMQREFVQLKDRLIANRDQAAVTPDGIQIELLANVNNVSDARMGAEFGAVGVGLFRTEYLYLIHPSVPDEDEQVEVYRQVIQATPNHRVTIRTLDLGGDKSIPYLGHHGEANPFLGWRSLRISFEHPDFFRTQMRAILRAGRYGRVGMLFPMVTTPEEMDRVQRMVRQARTELTRRRVPHGQVQIGVMIEVPAAAVCIDKLLESVDFVSIGSNDLTQYLMAADRDNPKVAHLCQPLSLAVLRVIKGVTDACNGAGKPVTLCGEMAGRPRAFLMLLGMGMRQFSLSPALIPTIKELVRLTPIAEAENLLRRVLSMKTAGQIRAYLTRHLNRLCPKLELLDTNQ
jgi:phosphoenolpyruvate-protein phosphotransferase (PTS system enzyme I)